jgi:hypothetical protein
MGSSNNHRIPERIQLAPLRCDPFDYSAPLSAGMQRQHSISSATDSGLSSYYGSSAGSPTLTPCGSPRSGESTTRASSPSFHGYRCSSCLDHGDHVPVMPGQPCAVCDTISPEQRLTGKAPRRKRNDRHLYSRLATGGTKTQSASKDQSEGGRRFDHTTLIGIHQEMLLKVNPNLPTNARIGNGRSKSGWKVLNPNNVSKDLVCPLTVNKSEILTSGPQVLDDSNQIIANVCDQLIGPLQSEATHLIKGNPSYSQLLKFVEQISDAKWTPRVEASCTLRGSDGFRVPFGAESKL